MTSIFAHRGYSGNYPENTMSAFRAAAKTGCAGIELDVQLSKDGEVVVIHDERLERTTNGTGFVKDYTQKELQKLDARNRFGTDIPFTTIPTLREYLDFIRTTNLFTNIELKTGKFEYSGIEQKVIDLVKEYGLLDRVWYSSFNHFTIQRVKQILPSAHVGLLIDCWMVEIGQYASNLKAASVNARSSFFTKKTTDELHSYGIKAQAWTPNTKEELTRLFEIGVDVLITNYPELGLKVVKNQ